MAEARQRVEATDRGLTATLLAVAAVGWWWAVRMSADMGALTALAPFVGAWLAMMVAMMVAMMLPAVRPVVAIYYRTAAAARLAPVPVFVAGYLAVWTVAGIPAFVGWRALIEPLMRGETWTGYLAGGVLIASAGYQLTTLKSVCLRQCRSPMTFFLRHAHRLGRPAGAVMAGANHGLWCLGCCWALMACLVALGAMQPLLMAAVAAAIYAEKATPLGQRATPYIAVLLAGAGIALLVHPSLSMRLT
jgi:predicted metal-binding membrane protein